MNENYDSKNIRENNLGFAYQIAKKVMFFTLLTFLFLFNVQMSKNNGFSKVFASNNELDEDGQKPILSDLLGEDLYIFEFLSENSDGVKNGKYKDHKITEYTGLGGSRPTVSAGLTGTLRYEKKGTIGVYDMWEWNSTGKTLIGSEFLFEDELQYKNPIYSYEEYLENGSPVYQEVFKVFKWLPRLVGLPGTEKYVKEGSLSFNTDVGSKNFFRENSQTYNNLQRAKLVNAWKLLSVGDKWLFDIEMDNSFKSNDQSGYWLQNKQEYKTLYYRQEKIGSTKQEDRNGNVYGNPNFEAISYYEILNNKPIFYLYDQNNKNFERYELKNGVSTGYLSESASGGNFQYTNSSTSDTAWNSVNTSLASKVGSNAKLEYFIQNGVIRIPLSSKESAVVRKQYEYEQKVEENIKVLSEQILIYEDQLGTLSENQVKIKTDSKKIRYFWNFVKALYEEEAWFTIADINSKGYNLNDFTNFKYKGEWKRVYYKELSNTYVVTNRENSPNDNVPVTVGGKDYRIGKGTTATGYNEITKRRVVDKSKVNKIDASATDYVSNIGYNSTNAYNKNNSQPLADTYYYEETNAPLYGLYQVIRNQRFIDKSAPANYTAWSETLANVTHGSALYDTNNEEYYTDGAGKSFVVDRGTGLEATKTTTTYSFAKTNETQDRFGTSANYLSGSTNEEYYQRTGSAKYKADFTYVSTSLANVNGNYRYNPYMSLVTNTSTYGNYKYFMHDGSKYFTSANLAPSASQFYTYSSITVEYYKIGLRKYKRNLIGAQVWDKSGEKPTFYYIPAAYFNTIPSNDPYDSSKAPTAASKPFANDYLKNYFYDLNVKTSGTLSGEYNTTSSLQNAILNDYTYRSLPSDMKIYSAEKITTTRRSSSSGYFATGFNLSSMSTTTLFGGIKTGQVAKTVSHTNPLTGARFSSNNYYKISGYGNSYKLTEGAKSSEVLSSRPSIGFNLSPLARRTNFKLYTNVTTGYTYTKYTLRANSAVTSETKWTPDQYQTGKNLISSVNSGHSDKYSNRNPATGIYVKSESNTYSSGRDVPYYRRRHVNIRVEDSEDLSNHYIVAKVGSNFKLDGQTVTVTKVKDESKSISTRIVDTTNGTKLTARFLSGTTGGDYYGLPNYINSYESKNGNIITYNYYYYPDTKVEEVSRKSSFYNTAPKNGSPITSVPNGRYHSNTWIEYVTTGDYQHTYKLFEKTTESAVGLTANYYYNGQNYNFGNITSSNKDKLSNVSLNLSSKDYDGVLELDNHEWVFSKATLVEAYTPGNGVYAGDQIITYGSNGLISETDKDKTGIVLPNDKADESSSLFLNLGETASSKGLVGKNYWKLIRKEDVLEYKLLTYNNVKKEYNVNTVVKGVLNSNGTNYVAPNGLSLGQRNLFDIQNWIKNSKENYSSGFLAPTSSGYGLQRVSPVKNETILRAQSNYSTSLNTGSYTITANTITSSGTFFVEVLIDGVVKETLNLSKGVKSLTFTLAKKSNVSFNFVSSNDTNKFLWIQLESGTSFTDYVPNSNSMTANKKYLIIDDTKKLIKQDKLIYNLELTMIYDDYDQNRKNDLTRDYLDGKNLNRYELSGSTHVDTREISGSEDRWLALNKQYSIDKYERVSFIQRDSSEVDRYVEIGRVNDGRNSLNNTTGSTEVYNNTILTPGIIGGNYRSWNAFINVGNGSLSNSNYINTLNAEYNKLQNGLFKSSELTYLDGKHYLIENNKGVFDNYMFVKEYEIGGEWSPEQLNLAELNTVLSIGGGALQGNNVVEIEDKYYLIYQQAPGERSDEEIFYYYTQILSFPSELINDTNGSYFEVRPGIKIVRVEDENIEVRKKYNYYKESGYWSNIPSQSGKRHNPTEMVYYYEKSTNSEQGNYFEFTNTNTGAFLTQRELETALSNLPNYQKGSSKVEENTPYVYYEGSYYKITNKMLLNEYQLEWGLTEKSDVQVKRHVKHLNIALGTYTFSRENNSFDIVDNSAFNKALTFGPFIVRENTGKSGNNSSRGIVEYQGGIFNEFMTFSNGNSPTEVGLLFQLEKGGETFKYFDELKSFFQDAVGSEQVKNNNFDIYKNTELFSYDENGNRIRTYKENPGYKLERERWGFVDPLLSRGSYSVELLSDSRTSLHAQLEDNIEDSRKSPVFSIVEKNGVKAYYLHLNDFFNNEIKMNERYQYITPDRFSAKNIEKEYFGWLDDDKDKNDLVKTGDGLKNVTLGELKSFIKTYTVGDDYKFDERGIGFFRTDVNIKYYFNIYLQEAISFNFKNNGTSKFSNAFLSENNIQITNSNLNTKDNNYALGVTNYDLGDFNINIDDKILGSISNLEVAFATKTKNGDYIPERVNFLSNGISKDINGWTDIGLLAGSRNNLYEPKSQPLENNAPSGYDLLPPGEYNEIKFDLTGNINGEQTVEFLVDSKEAALIEYVLNVTNEFLSDYRVTHYDQQKIDVIPKELIQKLMNSPINHSSLMVSVQAAFHYSNSYFENGYNKTAGSSNRTMDGPFDGLITEGVLEGLGRNDLGAIFIEWEGIMSLAINPSFTIEGPLENREYASLLNRVTRNKVHGFQFKFDNARVKEDNGKDSHQVLLRNFAHTSTGNSRWRTSAVVDASFLNNRTKEMTIIDGLYGPIFGKDYAMGAAYVGDRNVFYTFEELFAHKDQSSGYLPAEAYLYGDGPSSQRFMSVSGSESRKNFTSQTRFDDHINRLKNQYLAEGTELFDHPFGRFVMEGYDSAGNRYVKIKNGGTGTSWPSYNIDEFEQEIYEYGDIGGKTLSPFNSTFKTLDFDFIYEGDLPSTTPLVFRSFRKNVYKVSYNDDMVQKYHNENNSFTNSFNIDYDFVPNTEYAILIRPVFNNGTRPGNDHVSTFTFKTSRDMVNNPWGKTIKNEPGSGWWKNEVVSDEEFKLFFTFGDQIRSGNVNVATPNFLKTSNSYNDSSKAGEIPPQYRLQIDFSRITNIELRLSLFKLDNITELETNTYNATAHSLNLSQETKLVFENPNSNVNLPELLTSAHNIGSWSNGTHYFGLKGSSITDLYNTWESNHSELKYMSASEKSDYYNGVASGSNRLTFIEDRILNKANYNIYLATGNSTPGNINPNAMNRGFSGNAKYVFRYEYYIEGLENIGFLDYNQDGKMNTGLVVPSGSKWYDNKGELIRGGLVDESFNGSYPAKIHPSFSTGIRGFESTGFRNGQVFSIHKDEIRILVPIQVGTETRYYLAQWTGSGNGSVLIPNN